MSEKYSSKLDKNEKPPHDWRPFVKIFDTRKAPFSDDIYCYAFIRKQDFREMKGPPGAIIYGEEGDDFRIGFLKSELATLENKLGAS